MKHDKLTPEQWDLIKDKTKEQAEIISTWVDPIGDVHIELVHRVSKVTDKKE